MMKIPFIRITRAAMLASALACGGAALHAHAPAGGPAVTERQGMDLGRIGRILAAIDPELRAQGSGWRLTVEGQIVLVVTDIPAGRLRVMAPVVLATRLEPTDLEALLRANFDSALDARYALAEGLVWAMFARPLADLGKGEFISGLAQVVTLARGHGAGDLAAGLRPGAPESPAEEEGAAPDAAEDAPEKSLFERLLRRGSDL
ncbi:type III secretion system chaperone family protein [Roseovarius aquimarinus]|uniref:YbjN domain-containing protein n=1 Tax=Roseovarius aquimarinus TaxID=1229156 RepID=A0ABW7I371_9RHOB